jgi:uncharacterized repeat protein (TIGR01451 family)
MKTVISILLLIGLPVGVAMGEVDIEVQKSVNNEFPMPNEPVEFTVQADNLGDQAASGVVIIDQLPSEMMIPAGTAAFTSIGTYDPATGEWVIGDLNPGAGAVLILPAVISVLQPPGCIVNYASSEYEDILADNNDAARSAIHQPDIERCVDLSVSRNILGSPVGTGSGILATCDSQERYDGDVRLTNHGPDAARNVVVAISQDPVFGPNLRFDDADCNNAPAANCNLTEIAAGETVVIDVTSDLYQSYSVFTQSLSVSATTSDTDYDLSNNSPGDFFSAGGFSSCEEVVIIDDIFGPIGSGGCFIATAAYGSPYDSHLDGLREFRDRVLMRTRPGRALVQLYYQHSPPLADFIAERNWLRAAVRGVLAPLVFTIEHPTRTGLLLMISAVIILWKRRRHVAANKSSHQQMAA